MYAKLINGTPRYTTVPKHVHLDGRVIYNPPDSVLLNDLGYYKVQETDMPSDAPDGKHYESYLEYTDDKVVQAWKLVDDPVYPEPEPEATMQDLEAAIKEAINSDN